MDTPPPAGYARWNGTLLAKHLGDISKHQIWRVLREHEISLERRRSWGISTDPAFAQKAADIVALYLQPPENAVVLSVDEKPHIQALERAQGWLKLPNGKALTGFNHEYKRHGTTTLFAALEVATGLVKAGHYRRRRRVEFLHFMNRVLAEHPGREIHVILDNPNTHKPKHDRWPFVLIDLHTEEGIGGRKLPRALFQAIRAGAGDYVTPDLMRIGSHLLIPDRPGSGVEWDEDAITRYRLDA